MPHTYNQYITAWNVSSTIIPGNHRKLHEICLLAIYSTKNAYKSPKQAKICVIWRFIGAFVRIRGFL